MGIPRFAYRMRDYAETRVIGAENSMTHSQKKSAIVDGPSLAHFVLQITRCETNFKTGIIVESNYAELCKAVVQWLDRLHLYGFEIEGVYFDGALPSHKRNTRIERLQKSVDNLLKFKQIHNEVSRVTRSISTNIPSDWNSRRLEGAQRDLAAPPFLMLAVLEALFNSRYAGVTWVVPGEADPFCAVAAQEIASINTEASVSIFTNDSDLIIYNAGPQIGVVMINSVEERNYEDGRVLEALQFWPERLTKLGPVPLPDLIRPAYEMQDPHVSFQEALKRSKLDAGAKDFEEFAKSYSLNNTAVVFETLKSRRGRKKDLLQTDPRISELLHQAGGERRHLDKAKEHLKAGKGDTTMLDLNDNIGQNDEEGIQTSEPQLELSQRDKDLAKLESADLDMYLPILFEDPSRSTAWKIGTLFRRAAASLVLSMFGLHASPVFEYRRSGHGLNTYKMKKVSTHDAFQHFTSWHVHPNSQNFMVQNLCLSNIHRWRFAIMQLTLLDMMHENMTLPYTQDVANVIDGTIPNTWETIHFHAQYQAEYYSVLMLKEVLRYFQCTVSDDLSSSSEEYGMYKLLESLPSVSQFFDPASGDEMSVDGERWQELVGRFMSCLDPKPLTMPQGEDKGESVRKGKKRGKKKDTKSATSEMKGAENSANPFSALMEE